MNLNSLSDADLELLAAALMNITDDDNEEAMLVYGHVSKEIHDRKTNERSAKTGFQIELLIDGKWKPIDKTYLSIAVYSLFYPSLESAQKAMDRINSKIKSGCFEYLTKQIKKSEYRFAQVTTIHEIV
jgi:hypothetical protein